MDNATIVDFDIRHFRPPHPIIIEPFPGRGAAP
jgi:hypothetical protein